MVVNAPQSNVLSAAEHTIALLLAQARNIPQADRDLRNGEWNRTRWEGVELHGKTLGIVGLGRVGVLVAQRRLAFGMQLVAYDPYVSADRARQLGVELVPDLEELVAPRRLPHHPPAEDARDRRPDRGRAAHPRQADAADRQHRPRRHRRRGRAGRRRARRPDRRRRARRVRARAHHRVAAVRAARGRGHAAPRRVHGRGAGQGGPDHRRAGGARAARRVRALRGQPRRHRGERDGAAVPAARRAARSAVHRAGRRRRRHARDHLRGPDRRLRLPGAHAVGR